MHQSAMQPDSYGGRGTADSKTYALPESTKANELARTPPSRVPTKIDVHDNNRRLAYWVRDSHTLSSRFLIIGKNQAFEMHQR